MEKLLEELQLIQNFESFRTNGRETSLFLRHLHKNGSAVHLMFVITELLETDKCTYAIHDRYCLIVLLRIDHFIPFAVGLYSLNSILFV